MADAEAQVRLVLRAQSGDREALELLLRANMQPLLRYISRLTGPSAAEDVLQEVLLQICRKVRWLREPGLFLPWAFRIASRAAFAFLKREHRWSDKYDPEVVLENLPALSDSRLLFDMPTLLEEVSPASRAVLLLHYVEGLSLEDSAAILEINVGTAKSRLAYGLSCLRKTIKKGDKHDDSANRECSAKILG